MSAFVDTNILVRHLTGDPAPMATAATAFLHSATDLVLTDIVAAETVYVLQSFYRAPRSQIAVALRALIALEPVICTDQSVLLRAVEIYEDDSLDFAEAYLVACAEKTVDATVVSFDRAIDRIPTVTRIEPGQKGT